VFELKNMCNFYRKKILILMLLSVSYCGYSQIDHWEGILLQGDSYRYLLPTNEPDVGWTSLAFDDNSWEIGNSGFGYGDDDDNEVIPTSISIYLRTKFSITDITAIESVLFHMDYDDGFVAYLNGKEMARAGISGNPPTFDQPCDVLHEANLYQGFIPDE
jgi:hypothetical protein